MLNMENKSIIKNYIIEVINQNKGVLTQNVDIL